MTTSLSLPLALIAACIALPAQDGDPALLDAGRVASAEFEAARFGPARWLDDGAYATLEADGDGVALVRYDAATGERTILLPAARLRVPGRTEPLAIDDYAFSPDRSLLLVFTDTRRVWRYNTRGDYYVVDIQGDAAPRRLGAELPASSLMFAKWSPDGTRIAYVSSHDLYVEPAAGGAVTRLTADGSATTINGTFDWVYEEEFHTRDGFRWSPDGSRIAFWQLDASGVGEFLMIDNLGDRYSRTIPVQYPKAGTTNSACRIGVIGAAGGDPVWMQTPGDPRDTYLARMDWHPRGEELMVQWLPRAQNRLAVLACDAATGETRTVLDERDDAWIDVRDDFRWFAGGAAFFWTSERDGWRHGYVQPWEGGDARCVTPAEHDVMEFLHVGDDGGRLLYAASPDNATQRYLWVQEQGRPPRRLTPASEAGWHDYQVSPGGSFAIHTRSAFDRPPIIELLRLPSHELVRTLVDNHALRDRLAALQPCPHRLFRVATAGGIELDGWMMLPPGFDPDRRWPVLFHVYNEPWAQTVRDAWDLRHHMFHRWMTQRGYVVMSIDGRGTPAPRGRQWRKSIYQKIGIISSHDWNQGVRALGAEHPWIDRERLAIWGWSGGGAMTLNMLFRYPDLFAAGMSVAPVTEIGLYDTIYQERYCGHPEAAPEVYRACSPLSFAKDLEGALLLVHGTGDDNVHYQNSERLVDELIAHGKHFEFLAYPNRTHAIREGRNTRPHLYGSLADFLARRLPAGPR